MKECGRCGTEYSDDVHAYTDRYNLCRRCFRKAREYTHTGRRERGRR